eukprot:1156700-Pelagomonas_calceolata.AAC.8
MAKGWAHVPYFWGVCHHPAQANPTSGLPYPGTELCKFVVFAPKLLHRILLNRLSVNEVAVLSKSNLRSDLHWHGIMWVHLITCKAVAPHPSN